MRARRRFPSFLVRPSHRLACAAALVAAGVVTAVPVRAQTAQGTAYVVGDLPARSPLEHYVGIAVRYADVRVRAGYRVRVVQTRPAGVRTPIPAVFVVGWLSCDPVTYPDSTPDGYARLITDLVRNSGFAVYRVEKPGMGDSEGPRCEDADFEAELEAYRAGWRLLTADSAVDQRRRVILGLSNGGAVAPLVADGTPVAAFVSVGGWSKTWFEHMMELERRRMRLAGSAPAAISDSLRGYASFYDQYLNRRMTPGGVGAAFPALAGLWHDEPTRQYGRPAAYYHQLQALNIAEAWSAVDAPVLAVWGEYDWIMSRDDVVALPTLVRPAHRARSQFVQLPKTDHVLNEYGSAADAFRGEGGVAGARATPLVLHWIRGLLRR